LQKPAFFVYITDFILINENRLILWPAKMKEEMLNQKIEFRQGFCFTERTYIHTIYATITHHYILIYQHFTRSHTPF